MKTADQIKPNYAPLYCVALYPKLAYIFHQWGYALAVHGSMARDFDLIAVPWEDTAASPDVVLQKVLKEFALTIVGEPVKKMHGRLAYTLSVGFGECACDLSFMPRYPTVDQVV